MVSKNLKDIIIYAILSQENSFSEYSIYEEVVKTIDVDYSMAEVVSFIEEIIFSFVDKGLVLKCSDYELKKF